MKSHKFPTLQLDAILACQERFLRCSNLITFNQTTTEIFLSTRGGVKKKEAPNPDRLSWKRPGCWSTSAKKLQQGGDWIVQHDYDPKFAPRVPIIPEFCYFERGSLYVFGLLKETGSLPSLGECERFGSDAVFVYLFVWSFLLRASFRLGRTWSRSRETLRFIADEWRGGSRIDRLMDKHRISSEKIKCSSCSLLIVRDKAKISIVFRSNLRARMITISEAPGNPISPSVTFFHSLASLFRFILSASALKRLPVPFFFLSIVTFSSNYFSKLFLSLGDHARGLGGHHVLRHGRALLLQLHLFHLPHHRKCAQYVECSGNF